MSSLRRDDAVLWLLLGIAGIAAFYQARRTLYEFREVTVVTTEEKAQDVIGQHTEDAISVDTLGELYNSPDYHIKDAALKILLERAVHQENLELLLKYADSPYEQKREQAMVTLAYLIQNEVEKAFYMPNMYSLVIKNLMFHYHSRVRLNESNYQIDWKLRSPTERFALKVVRLTMEASSIAQKKWLDAGLISKWMRRYICWITGNTESEQNIEHMHKLVEKIMDGEFDDQDLAAILETLCGCSEARIQLKKYRILVAGSKYLREWDGSPETTPQSVFASPVAPAGLVTLENDESGNEQAALRRRRRQAIVIGDVGQPISQDNIYNAAETDTVEEFEGFRRVA